MGADLADMQLGSIFNKGIRFWFCVVYIFSKYAWVIPLKDKKDINITNTFQKILDESNRKPNKILEDKGSEFYNRSMKSWLEKNHIEMYSTHNEGTFVVAEKCIRTLKNKIYKHMTSISKNVNIDKLDDIVNKYDNTYCGTTKMKAVDVKSNTYINSSKEINDEYLKFKIGDIVRISKYKNIFAKDCVPKFLLLQKLKNNVLWIYVISNIKVEEIVGTFYEKEFQKTNQKEFRVEKKNLKKSR